MNGEEKIINLLESMQTNMQSMQANMQSMQADMQSMQADMQSMQADMQSMKTDITELKTDVTGLKIQVSENTQILKALEHKAEVNKAEHDNFTMQLARIEGSVNSLKSEISEMKKDHEAVEIITSKNWNEIARIKAAKY